MDLRHVRTFITLAEELHFGRAAARLHVAQSAVSQTLKALEEEVGTRLLARTRRKVELTPAGAHFLEHARRALGSLEEGSVAARRAAAGETGRLVLRFTLTSALSVLPVAIARFQRECPGVQLRIEAGGTTEQLEALRAGRCDIGFMVRTLDASPFACEVISEEPLVTLVPKKHPLASRRSIRFEQLAAEPLLMLSRQSEPELDARFRHRAEAAGFPPRVVLEVDQLDTLLAFVAAGLGLGHAPASVMRLRMDGVVAIPLSPRILSGVTAVWDPTTLSPAGRRFLDIVRQERDAARSR